ncbi:exonuclease 3'-5' domain-containing protein 2 [Microplitis mediator]|uniref:exonuclease 3'-5' domain-containing protein 2 n=1 Tax=Microplitis mediator TaxID=375433 RepID=UPI002553D869|nr:exonuclease 3'-5' domain-containing protein 2 [Microplitis mediator]
MILECITVGIILLATKYRNNVVTGVKYLCKNSNDVKSSGNGIVLDDNNNVIDSNSKSSYEVDNVMPALQLNKIILADDIQKCDYAVQRIRSELTDGVLGFDCEWVNGGSVSLLQLATNNGTCALIRLCKIGHVPLQLKELLSNSSIIKVGVSPSDDVKKLFLSYDCMVMGVLDLRLLAERLSVTCHQSLAALSLEYLNYEMEKSTDIRCGNWNADQLDYAQIQYAATDAIVSVLIYHEIIKEADKKKSTWSKIVRFIKNSWVKNSYVYYDIPKDIIDSKYRGSSKKINNNLSISNYSEKSNSDNIDYNYNNTIKQNAPTRKEPLYHNCYLEAPDGETLCTCDRKKAEWYIAKNLGVKVKDNPLTVRLNFEPSGRAMGQVGEYYTQTKVNQCVVCGAEDEFVKKNVVPKEYRKNFPVIMKAHQSHDCLLLCPRCHEISTRHDLTMRERLAEMCNAPLSKPLSQKLVEQNRIKRELMSAIKALRGKYKIPSQRRKQLQARILEYSGHDKITPQVLNFVEDKLIREVPSLAFYEDKPNHGLKVVEHFVRSGKGLVELERLWRQHFVTTMRPKYLPKLWSIDHNHIRLEMRASQNRIQPEDAIVAGLRY